jgi:hypothetical protein
MLPFSRLLVCSAVHRHDPVALHLVTLPLISSLHRAITSMFYEFSLQKLLGVGTLGMGVCIVLSFSFSKIDLSN